MRHDVDEGSDALRPGLLEADFEQEEKSLPATRPQTRSTGPSINDRALTPSVRTDLGRSVRPTQRLGPLHGCIRDDLALVQTTSLLNKKVPHQHRLFDRYKSRILRTDNASPAPATVICCQKQPHVNFAARNSRTLTKQQRVRSPFVGHGRTKSRAS